MLDQLPHRLRESAVGMAKATQMMAGAKSQRNQAAGDEGSCYRGLKKEQTAEWQAAELIEKMDGLLAKAGDALNFSTRTGHGDLGSEITNFRIELRKSRVLP